MFRSFHRLTVAGLLAALLAGCASVDARPSFDEVSAAVEARAGLRPVWSSDAEGELALAARRHQILAAELTPESAGELALLSNRDLLAHVEELGIARADYAQATRIANPTLGGFSRRPSRGGGSNVELELAENLFDVLVQPLRARLGAMELEAAKLGLGQIMLDTIAEARVATYELIAAQQLVDRLTKIRELADAAAELSRRQLAAGNVAALDVAQNEAMAVEAALALDRARLATSATRERLQVVLGLSGDELPWQATRSLPALPPADPALGELEQQALASRLDLAAGRAAVDVVGRALALRHKTRFFPAGIEVGVSREKDLDGLRVTGPTLRVELPIFDTGKASIARLEAEERRARRQLEGLVIATRAEVRLERERLLTARATTASYRDRLLPLRITILDQTLRHYNMMLLGVYDVLAARRAELETEKEYVESWRDYWIARARLERAVGSALGAPAPPAAGEIERSPTVETDAPEQSDPAEHSDHTDSAEHSEHVEPPGGFR